MNLSLDFELINKIGVYLSIFISATSILYWMWRFSKGLIELKKINDVKQGIYNGYWIDPIKQQINCEVLRVKKSITGITATPIYKHKAAHNYLVRIKPYFSNKLIFGGNWKGQENSIYRGFALFKYNLDESSYSGRWIGPRSSGDINGGDWFMCFASKTKNIYLKYKRHRKFFELKERLFPIPSIIDNIIFKHETHTSNTCTINNITLLLNNESFIPTIGKISIPMIEYVSSITKSSDSVLDLGTGTGFYPIFLAKNNNCRVKGIDIDDRTIALARENAISNAVDQLVVFEICQKNEIFSCIKQTEKYDLIIANLPFTRISKCYKSRNKLHFTSFGGSVSLLEQLILGSQYHINPNGKLIFCYGESGYTELLDAIIKISSWKFLKKIRTIKANDDTFYIYETELSPKVKSYYQRILAEQTSFNDNPSD